MSQSRSKTWEKLEVSVSFEKVGQDISYNFVYFCNSEQLASEFVTTDITNGVYMLKVNNKH